MTGLYVETQDLRKKARQIRELEFTNPKQRAHLVVPDKLVSSQTAIDNLDSNASALYTYQANGAQEGVRLAETLESVADAYDEVDAQAQAHIDGTDGPPEPVTPRANSVNDPTTPEPPQAQAGVSAGGTSLVEETEAKLAAGDTGTSLMAAKDSWIKTGTELRDSANAMDVPVQNWEGEAAQEAYRKLHEFADWMRELATSWDQLAGEALVLVNAHRVAKSAHTEIYQEYMALQAQMQQASTEGGAAHQLGEKMAQLQQSSDDLREAYARAEQRQVVSPPQPPVSNVPTAPVTQYGSKPAPEGNPTLNDSGDAGAASGGGGGGGGGGQAPATDPSTAQTSPMSAEASQPSKESGSGGSPSGGESPSGGGGSGGGLPELPTDTPGSDENAFTPGDPTLSPASAGGSGGGSGGGGAGGGGSAPLQPSVSGVAVGPSPSPGGGTGGAGPTGAGSSGGAAGGTGGMGGTPMHGAGQQGGGAGEKKRSPGLSPDEELYTEDRPHTEGVIGRTERRAGQGKKDAT